MLYNIKTAILLIDVSLFLYLHGVVTGSSISKYCGMYANLKSYYIKKLMIFGYITDLKECESYTATEYKYSIYHKLFEYPATDENLIDFKFYAIAQKDVFVLLSPMLKIRNETIFYEFGMLVMQ